MEREKLVHLPRNQRRRVKSVTNGTKGNVLASTSSQAIVCMKTTLTLSETGTTIITMETQVLDVLIIVTRNATIARRMTTSSATVANGKQIILLEKGKKILSRKSWILWHAIRTLLWSELTDVKKQWLFQAYK